MELTLLRHGLPVEPYHWNGAESTRPLTPAGRAQARAVLEALRNARQLAIDEIWCSPYTRCHETAQLAAQILGHVPLHRVQGLASGATLINSLSRAQGSPESWPARLLCVGHMPDLGNLIAELLGASSSQYGLGRAGTARLSGVFTPAGMQLHWLYSAEEAIALVP